jgi:hypothetical protein
MKKSLLLLTLLIALPMGLTADQLTTLVVLTKDHAQHQFVIAEAKPQVTFEGSDLKVTCAKTSASATFALKDVLRFTYVKTEADGIDELKNDDGSDISLEGGTLVISQLKANTTVGIYTTDGRLVQQLKARRTGSYRFSLSQLPHGVYLVKAGNTTYKITKR